MLCCSSRLSPDPDWDLKTGTWRGHDPTKFIRTHEDAREDGIWQQSLDIDSSDDDDQQQQQQQSASN